MVLSGEEIFVDIHYKLYAANNVSFSYIYSGASWRDDCTAVKFEPVTENKDATVLCSVDITPTASGVVATATPPTWYELPVTSSDVVAYGAGCKYTRDQFGLVTVRLMLKKAGGTGVAPTIIVATLPSGYRPAVGNYNGIFYQSSNGLICSVYITGGGEVKITPLLMGEGHTSILIENIECALSFYAF